MYHDKVIELINRANEKNAETIVAVAKLVKEKIDQGGMLFVFGSGHSSLLCEEAFHRAGGLIPVYPVLMQELTPHVPPKIASATERTSGIAQKLFERCNASSKDVFFIASQSGINAVSIEMAELCRSKKINTVAFTSLEHSMKTPSRHSSGKKLYELCDYVLDNGCPVGDGLVEFDAVRVSAGSSIANSYLYGRMLTTLCELWHAEGKILPVYKSANIPGGDEHNVNMEKKYKSRNPLL